MKRRMLLTAGALMVAALLTGRNIWGHGPSLPPDPDEPCYCWADGDPPPPTPPPPPPGPDCEQVNCGYTPN